MVLYLETRGETKNDKQNKTFIENCRVHILSFNVKHVSEELPSLLYDLNFQNTFDLVKYVIKFIFV